MVSHDRGSEISHLLEYRGTTCAAFLVTLPSPPKLQPKLFGLGTVADELNPSIPVLLTDVDITLEVTIAGHFELKLSSIGRVKLYIRQLVEKNFHEVRLVRVGVEVAMAGAFEGVVVLECLELVRKVLGNLGITDAIFIADEHRYPHSADLVDSVERLFHIVRLGPVIDVFLEAVSLVDLKPVIGLFE